MAKIMARKVADFFIGLSHGHGDPLSNLKLQKLLYYAQAWHLALNDAPLFGERIEAWVHGPAVPTVYGQFKGWAWKPIEHDPPNWRNLPTDVSQHLHEVMDAYGGLTAYDLERLTHSEAPWRNARAGLPPDEPSSAIIEHEEMKQFYRNLAAQQTGQSRLD